MGTEPKRSPRRTALRHGEVGCGVCPGPTQVIGRWPFARRADWVPRNVGGFNPRELGCGARRPVRVSVFHRLCPYPSRPRKYHRYPSPASRPCQMFGTRSEMKTAREHKNSARRIIEQSAIAVVAIVSTCRERLPASISHHSCHLCVGQDPHHPSCLSRHVLPVADIIADLLGTHGLQESQSTERRNTESQSQDPGCKQGVQSAGVLTRRRRHPDARWTCYIHSCKSSAGVGAARRRCGRIREARHTAAGSRTVGACPYARSHAPRNSLSSGRSRHGGLQPGHGACTQRSSYRSFAR